MNLESFRATGRTSRMMSFAGHLATQGDPIIILLANQEEIKHLQRDHFKTLVKKEGFKPLQIIKRSRDVRWKARGEDGVIKFRTIQHPDLYLDIPSGRMKIRGEPREARYLIDHYTLENLLHPFLLHWLQWLPTYESTPRALPLGPPDELE